MYDFEEMYKNLTTLAFTKNNGFNNPNWPKRKSLIR